MKPIGIVLLLWGWIGGWCQNALHVTIAHPDGTPASGATVVLYSSSELLEMGFTDDEGCVVLPSPESAATLIVTGAGWFPHRRSIARGQDRVHVALPNGEFIRGRIFVRGEGQTQPVRISLRGPRSSEVGGAGAAWIGELPRDVYLALFRLDPTLLSQLTSTDGAFCFSGFPEGWGGSLVPEPGYELESQTMAQHVSAGEDVELWVQRKPGIYGAAVDSNGNLAVSGASVLVHVEIGEADEAPSIRTSLVGRTNERGRFSLEASGRVVISSRGMPRRLDALLEERGGNAKELVVEIWDPQGRRAWRTERSNVHLSRGFDLGDIVLEPVGNVRVAARGPDGKPIEGAVLFPAEPGIVDPRSCPSTESGEAMYRGVTEGVEFVLIAAPGFRKQRVRVPGNRLELAQAVLSPTAILEIQVRAPENLPLASLEVVVEVEAASFFADERPRDEIDIEMCSPPPARIGQSSLPGRRGRRWMAFFPDQEGKIVLSDVAVGVPIKVRLAERMEVLHDGRTRSLHRGRPVGPPKHLELEPGEHHVVQFP